MRFSSIRPAWVVLSLAALVACTVCGSTSQQPCGSGAAVAGEGKEQPRPGSNKVEHVEDLTYYQVNKIQLKLDLARPARGDGPFPAAIILNGGSWMDLWGNRKKCKPLLLRLAEHGYVAVAATHRSIEVAAFPAQLHDARAAVRWLRDRAGQYRLDPNRIAAVGFSSGGQLACLLGSTTPADFQEAAEKQSSRVQVVVACYAPTDLAALRQRASQDKPDPAQAFFTLLILNKLVPPGQKIGRASPCTYVRRQAAPVLLIHGTADQFVPCEQSDRYARQLKDVGASVRLLKLDGAEHGFGSGSGRKGDKESDDATLEFLDQQLKAQPGAK